MRLVRLLYCSRATAPVSLDGVRELAEASARHNRDAGITGVLIFDPTMYLQALEGPRSAVNELYLRIARDRRHRDVTIIDFQEVGERLFDAWSMGFLGPLLKWPDLIEEFGGDAFQPFEMRAEAVNRLLPAMAKSALLKG